MKLDQAVLDLLHLDAAHTTVSRTAGGCSSASAAKISTKLTDGTEKRFFMKTATGPAGKVMVQGEDASLKAIHAVVPTLCPQSFGWGSFTSPSSPSTYFIVVDFLDPSSPPNSPHPNPNPVPLHQLPPRKSLAEKLAQLHTTPAPLPEGYSTPQFGFPVPTCCGDTAQDNSYKSSWASFYAENRLLFILQRAEAAENGGRCDGELRGLVERTISHVVPRLLGDEHLNNGLGVMPVVVHGDLWSGNAGRGSLAGRGVEEVIFDPSAFYGHSEYELGIMRMFGGFGGGFLEEYHQLCPKAEPVGEYEDRVALYEL
ncbi:1-phosphatidylinositol-3-phosphate 5-kinase [[Emmonsia] crescens]|uniref:protein-ribulosamine 3-kinase n=1 Tax=[Emmonsia] crescens TaxID=73230 RepID=A0A2B7Z7X6_9EURO|nr:1-phosphatidylinositol-3-phosphate 5-kinase [Emmonsia crescens]